MDAPQDTSTVTTRYSGERKDGGWIAVELRLPLGADEATLEAALMQAQTQLTAIMERFTPTGVVDDPGNRRLGFGQYRERTIAEVHVLDPQYLDWVRFEAEKANPALKQAIAEFLNNQVDPGGASYTELPSLPL